MLKNSLFALTALCAAASVASAEDETPTPTPTPAPTPMAPSGGGPFTKGTMGISVAVPGAAPSYAVDFVYFLNDKAAVDLLGGIVFNHSPSVTDPVTMQTSGGNFFGFSLGAGYRMYTHKGQVIHTYIQPYGLLSSLDVGHIADTFGLQLGVNFGAEAFVNDWLSFRGQVGGAFAANSQTGKTFSNIGVATTTGLFANVYWK